jgi:hypothetical protein
MGMEGGREGRPPSLRRTVTIRIALALYASVPGVAAWSTRDVPDDAHAR